MTSDVLDQGNQLQAQIKTLSDLRISIAMISHLDHVSIGGMTSGMTDSEVRVDSSIVGTNMISGLKESILAATDSKIAELQSKFNAL
jgi:hypothetical protein